MAPVRYKCERVEVFPAENGKPALVMDDCEWEADEGIKAVKLECEKSRNRYIVTRNMDDARDKYPWRVTRIDMESGEPWGHSYGKDVANALNQQVQKWEKCKVTAVRTVSGREDFGRTRLGKLTRTLDSSAPSLEARRVIRAFLRGEAARGACRGKGSARTCAISSDGKALLVSGATVASRENGKLKVCVPSTTDMQMKGRKRRETEEAKDVRVAASTILRQIASIGVRNNPQGERLLAAKGKAALLFPDACVQVKIPKRKLATVIATIDATEAARTRYKTQFPSKKQVDTMRAAAIAAQRAESLERAQQQRWNVKSPSARVAPGEDLPPEALAWDVPEYERQTEAEDLDWLTAADRGDVLPSGQMLPTNVPYPTDTEAFLRFEQEYIPSLRAGARREMALAWRAYLLDPLNAPSPVVKAKTDRERKAAREVELEIAAEYGIPDPRSGFMDPVMAQQTAAQRRSQKARKGKPGKTRDRAEILRNREWAEEMRQAATTDVDDYYNYRRSRG